MKRLIASIIFYAVTTGVFATVQTHKMPEKDFCQAQSDFRTYVERLQSCKVTLPATQHEEPLLQAGETISPASH